MKDIKNKVLNSVRGGDKKREVAKRTSNREWARDFRGTIDDFQKQSRERGFSPRSTKHWVRYNWDYKGPLYEKRGDKIKKL
jgi:hypothetical protein